MMKEQLYHELLEAIADIVNDDQLKEISPAVNAVLAKYDVSKREKDLIVYDGIPNCVKTYLVTRKIEGTSMKTLELYKLRLTQFFEMCPVELEQIKANDVRLFLYQYQEEHKVSDRTMDGIRGIIATFFKWAEAESYIPKNPCANIKAIKYTCKEREYLSEVELELLRKSAGTLRNKAMVEFFYSTGCRVSELIGVKRADIDFDKGEVTLFGKGSKYRKSYLNVKATMAINEYLASRDDDNEYLFVTERHPTRPLKKEAVEKTIRELGEDAGIQRKVFPHLIRHTTATMGLQRGMDVTEIQKMLGHVNIATTLIYAKVADETIKLNHKKCIV